MKKISLLMLLILLIVPLNVRAAEIKVLELDVSAKDNTIKYNGTMDDGATAVMCKLFNSEEDEVDKLSSAVDGHKFAGEFTIDKNDTYTIYCANYEGGAISSKEVIVSEIKELVAPKTGDNILTYVGIGAIGLIGIAASVIVFKKRKN